jgi:hypothetical protein
MNCKDQESAEGDCVGQTEHGMNDLTIRFLIPIYDDFCLHVGIILEKFCFSKQCFTLDEM